MSGHSKIKQRSAFHMMTGIQKIIVFTCCIGGLGISSAWAGVGVDLLADASYSMASGSPTPASALGFPGGGARLNFRLGAKFDLQLGGFYETFSYNNASVRTITMIDGQVGLKWKLGKVISFNFGGY